MRCGELDQAALSDALKPARSGTTDTVTLTDKVYKIAAFQSRRGHCGLQTR